MRHQSRIRFRSLKGSYFFAGVALAVGYYFADAMIMAFVFEEGGGLWDNIVRPTADDIWMRSSIAVVLIAFGGFIQEQMNSQHEKQDSLARGLNNSEARLQLILDSVPAAISYLDREERFRFANESHKAILNVQPETLIGMTLKEAIGDKAYGRAEQYVKRALAGEVVAFENDWPASEIGPTAISISYVPHLGQDDSIDGFFAVTHDISKRKEAEDAIKATANVLDELVTERTAELEQALMSLRESEERYQRVVEGTNDGLWDWNILTDKTYYSPRWAEIVGHTQDELGTGSNRLYERLHPDDRDRVWSDMQAHLKQRTPFQNIEFQIRHKNGDYIWVRSKGRAVWNEDGQAIRMAGSLTDISERKSTDEKLRNSEKRYRSIIDTTNEGFARTDNDLKIVEVNDALCQMLGFQRDEILGKRPYELETETGNPGLEERIKENKRQAVGATNREVQFRRQNGSILEARVSANDFYDGEGNTTGRFCFVTDITQQKESEAQLRQAQKMEAVGQLTGGIAHDFNNLLTVIYGNIEALENRLEKDDPLQQFASSAMQGALRGAELTQSLLAFSRKQRLMDGKTDINGLVLGMQHLFQRTLGETIAFKTSLAEDLWQTSADAGQIESALLNFVLNARDAMPDGGTITVTSSNLKMSADTAAHYDSAEAGEYVTLVVRDTGSGMTKEQVAHAFEPFYTTKQVGAGSGLGLSVAYGFAKQSGGCLEIDSEPGKGTTIRLCLPRYLGEKVDEENEERLPTSPIRGSGKIMVVEDDAEVRNLVVIQLKDLGYEAIEAADGPAMLALLNEHPEIDLLFSDVVLPGGMTGPEAAVRACQERPNLKILLTSGYPEKDVRRLDVDGRDVAILRKPYRKAELAEAIAAAMNSD